MGEVVKDGWLSKSSAGKQGLNHKLTKENWQRRYFVLRAGQQPKLVYYKDENAFRTMAAPSGQLMLRGAAAELTGAPASASGELVFQVTAAARVLPLRCAADAAHEWIRVINATIAGGGATAAPVAAGPVAGIAALSPPASGRQRVMFNPLDFTDDAHVYKEGWLMKRSGGAVKGGKGISVGNMRKNWDKRWFVLKRERLCYYKAPDDMRNAKPERGSCSVARVKVAEYDDIDPDSTVSKERRFKLRAIEPDGSERLFTLEATSKEDCSRWVDTIESLHEAVYGGNGTPAPSPLRSAPLADPERVGAASAAALTSSQTLDAPSSAGAPTFNPMNRVVSGGGGATFNPMDALVDDDDDDDDDELGMSRPGNSVQNPLADLDEDEELGLQPPARLLALPPARPPVRPPARPPARPPLSAVGSLGELEQLKAQWSEREKALKDERGQCESKVYKEGYLQKKSGGQQAAGDSAGISVKGVKGLANKAGVSTSKLEKWDRRYFVLKCRRFFYYKDHQAFVSGEEPRGSINTQGCQLVPSDKDSSRAKFKLQSSEPDGSVRMFTLEAADRVEMDQWVAQLSVVAQDNVRRLAIDAELQHIQAERDAAKHAALQSGIAVDSLEPQPEPEEVPASSAPKIAVKMEPAHLGQLVAWEMQPKLQGWLLKQSGGASDAKKSVGNLRKKEDRRWFVLQHHFVFYFERQQDFDAHVNPKGALPVAGAQVTDNLNMMDMEQRCTFHVVAMYADGQRDMTLRAETEMDAANWLAALRPHVEMVTVEAAEVQEHEDATDDENHVYCEGWLAKRSGGKKGDGVSVGELKKSWETRWFVLQANQIAYYKSQQAFLHREKAKATIPLQDMAFERGDGRLFKLKAVALGRVLALEAPSTEDVEKWERAISHRLEHLDEQKAADLQKVEEIVREKKTRFGLPVRSGTAEERLADLQAATSDTRVLRDGWLKKETGGKGGKPSAATLKQVGNLGHAAEDVRFFVLTPLYLRYYEAVEDVEHDRKPKGTVQMAGCTLEHRNKPGKQFKPKFKLVIPSSDGGRRMLSLIANDRDDMESWIQMIEKAIARANEKAVMDKTGDYGGNPVAEKLALLTHEGNLEKKGKAVVAGKAAFQTRWFRLRDGVLYYYQDTTDTVPINWIQLDSQTTVTIDDEDMLKFRILTGHGKKFVLRTIIDDNGKSREEWVKAIFGVVNVYCMATGEKPTADPLRVRVSPPTMFSLFAVNGLIAPHVPS